MTERGLPGILAVVFVLSLLLASPAAAIDVFAPRDGAVLGDAGVVLAGKSDSPGTLAVKLNGKGLSNLNISYGYFSIPLTLQKGKNVVEITSRGQRMEVTYEYRDGGGTYRLHAGYGEGDCSECHPGGPGKRGGPDSALCHECHDRMDGARFLHGPVGAGQCTSCHDPHGSSFPSFTRAPGATLCVSCHDQPSSESHLKAGLGQGCEKCHNPHGSAKKFFLY